jgi:hypothetical protein
MNSVQILTLCNAPKTKDWAVVFVHNSKHDTRNNSRYITLGMYAAKGVLASYFHKYQSGTGTQLQHYIGNCFGNAHLAKLFDDWQLADKIKIDNKVKIDQQKHNFVWAILGYLSAHATAYHFLHFILMYFVEPNKEYSPTALQKLKDKWMALLMACAEKYKVLPHIIITTKVKLNTVIVYCGTSVIGSSTSTNQKLAKEKAIHLALQNVLADADTSLLGNSTIEELAAYLTLKTTKQKEAAKATQLALLAAKQEKKKLEKIKKQLAKRAAAKKLDEQRRKVKQQAKQKVEKKQSVYREYSAEEISNMTAGKRRRLEDLGILSKK